MKAYNKLVRDFIPNVIQRNGKMCDTTILSEDAYINALDKKLQEETSEYLESKSQEEIADILEVLRAIAVARGYDWDEIETIREDKKMAKGGFEKRIFLMTTFDKNER